MIDLTRTLEPGMPVWPTLPLFRCERTGSLETDGSTMEEVEMTTHTGTHVDLPLHFVQDGEPLDAFGLDRFIGEGVVLDVSGGEPGDPIGPEDVEPLLANIREGDVVFLHTGWDEHYGTPEYVFEYPFLSAETAQVLAETEPSAVGTDALSLAGWAETVPEHGPTTDVLPEQSHVPLLERGIIVVEELTNLDKVLKGRSGRRARFFFPPLKLRGTGGAPVRAFAVL